MANFGLSYPWIANLNVATGAYSDGFKCGEAVNTAVTPNYSEAPLYGDNRQVENVSEFKNANVTLAVTRLPVKASKLLFGHTVSAEGEETSKGNDSAPYVGYAFITAEMENGIKRYRACLLLKVQFKEGEDSYETKGDSIVFKNPSLSGLAFSNDSDEWRIKSPYYDTEYEADQWIQRKLGVKEQCKAPVASVRGGEYQAAQSVVLSTGTEGATIRYTTDGTTPSATNGIEYGSPISISANTGLRAVAFKDSADPSAVMFEEYFIVTS